MCENHIRVYPRLLIQDCFLYLPSPLICLFSQVVYGVAAALVAFEYQPDLQLKSLYLMNIYTINTMNRLDMYEFKKLTSVLQFVSFSRLFTRGWLLFWLLL